MNNRTIFFILFLLLTVLSAKGQYADSLTISLQRGDSLMQLYNTCEALKY